MEAKDTVMDEKRILAYLHGGNWTPNVGRKTCEAQAEISFNAGREECADLYEALKALDDWVINLPDDAMMHVLKTAPMNKVAFALAKASK